MKNFIHTVILIALLLASCNKKNEAATASKTTLLTSGSWRLTASKEDDDANGSYETDNYAMAPDCFKDNYYTFNTNGKMEINEGPAKCSVADPQTDMVSWQFANNETLLIVDSDSYSVEELTTTTLSIKQALSGNRSAMVTFTKK